ncbi:hypothetical protein PVAP13_2KG385205 [Panicum virgatum]|uniref:Uncharacterized protein n=1 Tax=Panicum virgatum TaxID=38727 RepID=A0A8T0WFF8_PANVG|nr:hypothetical protein PVAP13_2KG385205 [Panicum virgatum]
MKAKRQTKQISSHVRLILEAPFFSLVEISQQLEAGQDVLRLAVGSNDDDGARVPGGLSPWPLPACSSAAAQAPAACASLRRACLRRRRGGRSSLPPSLARRRRRGGCSRERGREWEERTKM